MNALTLELAHAAARLVVEEGLEYAAAKRKAARALSPSARRPELPSNEAVEDAVREELALFHADSQPTELRALRGLALRWMERLADFRPHLGGAVWRGTATRLSAIHLDLYADDPKSPEIALLNLHVTYDARGSGHGGPGEPQATLVIADRPPSGGGPVTLFLAVHDHDALRGALKPDSRGRSWRGDLQALRRLLEADPQ
ncbi:MAG TPA: hypothetical protein VFQ16_13425 [Burkholderiaceae bacterium]|nr:hypothetical protein [Burkholderiaceae bacterium]